MFIILKTIGRLVASSPIITTNGVELLVLVDDNESRDALISFFVIRKKASPSTPSDIFRYFDLVARHTSGISHRSSLCIEFSL